MNKVKDLYLLPLECGFLSEANGEKCGAKASHFAKIPLSGAEEIEIKIPLCDEHAAAWRLVDPATPIETCPAPERTDEQRRRETQAALQRLREKAAARKAGQQ